jgi:hypothetical protein
VTRHPGGADEPKPATAARIYDFMLGGVHNFPADRDAARQVIAQFPFLPALARSNRAFLGRAVAHVAQSGVRQFLDLGSGIPTVDNVHEVVEQFVPDARVVYVDIDPVAISESLDLLEGNERVIAVRGDVRTPRAILDHPQVRRQLDFGRPVGLLMAAVLHFVPEDELAYGAVAELVAAVAPGSYLVVSHTAAEVFRAHSPRPPAGQDVYRRQTSTPGTVRTRTEVTRFFAGFELLEPGVVAAPSWRPDKATAYAVAEGLQQDGIWVGVGRKR